MFFNVCQCFHEDEKAKMVFGKLTGSGALRTEKLSHDSYHILEKEAELGSAFRKVDISVFQENAF